MPDAFACEYAERLAVDRVAASEYLVEMARKCRFFFARSVFGTGGEVKDGKGK